MDDSEKIAAQFLAHQGHTDILYEPDGNIPPDFLVGGRIAIEVRRLNQSHRSGSNLQGLEETEIPLLKRVRSLAASFGPPRAGVSWFVTYTFRRPLSWKKLEPPLRKALGAFADGTAADKTSWTFGNAVELELYRASKPHETFFVMGAYIDDDSGGWLLSEMENNLKICIAEKTIKIARVRQKYPEWWLILVDYIGYGLDDFDREMFRDQVPVSHNWNKVMLLDPRNPTRAFEL